MMELGDAAGDILEVELGLSVDEPGFAAVRPENRQFQSNLEVPVVKAGSPGILTLKKKALSS